MFWPSFYWVAETKLRVSFCFFLPLHFPFLSSLSLYTTSLIFPSPFLSLTLSIQMSSHFCPFLPSTHLVLHIESVLHLQPILKVSLLVSTVGEVQTDDLVHLADLTLDRGRKYGKIYT